MTLHMNITKWSISKSDWLYSLQLKIEKLYTVTKTRPGADCGSDPQLLTAKFRLKLKKVGKTTRPFRYDLNQIPYDYTVEVMKRFKGLDLVDRVPEELWTGVCNICTWGSDQNQPEEKQMQEGKVHVWGGFTNSEERRETKSRVERERYTQRNSEFQRIARTEKKAFFSEQCKEIE